MGVVEAAGPDGRNVRAGDRVVVPFTISCGDCFFCGKAEPSPTAASNSAWQPVGPLPESTLSDEPVLFLSDIHSGLALRLPTGSPVLHSRRPMLESRMRIRRLGRSRESQAALKR